MNPDTIEIVRGLGVLGILGSFTIMVTDWVGWTRPMSTAGKAYDMTGVDSRWRNFHASGGMGISQPRRYWSCIVGGFAMLPCGLGFVTIYVGLLPAGAIGAAFVACTLGGIMAYGVIAHTMYGVFNDLNDSREQIEDGTPERAVINHLYAATLGYWVPFGLGLVAIQAVGSFVFSYIVLTQNTAFPAWMGFINHFLLSQICMQSKHFLPFSMSRWLGPPHMHLLTTLPLLVLGTYYTWNGVVLP